MAPRITALVGGGQAAGKKSVCKAIVQCLNAWEITNVAVLSLSDYSVAVTTPSEGPETVDVAAAVVAITKRSEDVLLVEGMYALYEDAYRAVGNVRIYVDLDADERLSRRIVRDSEERGMTLQQVLDNYIQVAKPAMEQYVQGTKSTADVVLMRGTEPSGIELIAGGIYDRLSADGTNQSSVPSILPDGARLFDEDDNAGFYELA
ncbi:uridine kinase family-domain-containing protein [Limtongia smithiae]|uniref:uridine kinase family-domain-containing protein n=1 Tax=Limtongia smithiae TaxID=1125753 RepID=UPI0034CE364E